jgi:DNA-binding MarR family transcriptional regulator
MSEPYYAEESIDLGQSVGHLLKRCGALMTQIAERRFASAPISFTQWIILTRLVRGQPASPTELSASLGHDMGALTRVVDDLVRNNLVQREHRVHDRRSVQITVTPEGRRVAQVTDQIMVDLLNELLAPYSREEVDAFISMLQRFLSRMPELARSGASQVPA